MINFTVKDVKGKDGHLECQRFIDENHYSKKCPINSELFYNMYDGTKLIGSAVLSKPAGQRCQGVYSKTGKTVLELRRLCLIDDTPKNSESYFIGHILRDLKRKKIYDGVLSYADPEYGHSGIIYKASNFKYLGVQKYKQTNLMINVETLKTMHKRTVFGSDRYKAMFDAKLIVPKQVQPKHIYYYQF